MRLEFSSLSYLHRTEAAERQVEELMAALAARAALTRSWMARERLTQKTIIQIESVDHFARVPAIAHRATAQDLILIWCAITTGETPRASCGNSA